MGCWNWLLEKEGGKGRRASSCYPCVMLSLSLNYRSHDARWLWVMVHVGPPRLPATRGMFSHGQAVPVVATNRFVAKRKRHSLPWTFVLFSA